MPPIPPAAATPGPARERQVTSHPCGHVLTNAGVWSPDARRVVYDTRSDPAGSTFDGVRIERVDVDTGHVERLYESADGACCGVVTHSPAADEVVFILGPARPTPDWTYGPARRQGVVVRGDRPGVATNLDARDLVPPFTPGALRGGTHVHAYAADGRWVSFTYEDHVLGRFARGMPGHDVNLRGVGVCVPAGPVAVPGSHPRNHGGSHFAVLVTRLTADPRPGTDEISRAVEEAWVGTDGYVRPDGARQRRALAFQGDVRTAAGATVAEAFVVDLQDDPTVPGDDGPLQGTAARRPAPPRGTVQRRLTFTAGRRYPGLQGPRHWLRSAPDGSRIGLLMRDDVGTPQLWTVPTTGGEPVQVTRHPAGVSSAFTWSPDGRRVAHVSDRSVFVTEVSTGRGTRLTARSTVGLAPRPEACVFSPDGATIAFVRTVGTGTARHNQIFVVPSDGGAVD